MMLKRPTKAARAASIKALAQARKAMYARLDKYRLPHVVVKFSREECYD
jgi:hypothetical protein